MKISTASVSRLHPGYPFVCKKHIQASTGRSRLEYLIPEWSTRATSWLGNSAPPHSNCNYHCRTKSETIPVLVIKRDTPIVGNVLRCIRVAELHFDSELLFWYLICWILRASYCHSWSRHKIWYPFSIVLTSNETISCLFIFPIYIRVLNAKCADIIQIVLSCITIYCLSWSFDLEIFNKGCGKPPLSIPDDQLLQVEFRADHVKSNSCIWPVSKSMLPLKFIYWLS